MKDEYSTAWSVDENSITLENDTQDEVEVVIKFMFDGVQTKETKLRVLEEMIASLRK